MKTVFIADYFSGNIYSVTRAFTSLGCKVLVSDKPDSVGRFDYLVLPGVGAFGDGMAALLATGLLEAIIEFAESGKPLLGICLGMQLLLSESEELGYNRGLNLVPGSVKKLPISEGLKIPHIGWSAVLEPEEGAKDWNNTLLHDYHSVRDLYFIHSFAVHPNDDRYCLGETIFGCHRFCSILKKENIVGCQFHPEKSGKVGLKIIENFLRFH